MSNTLQINDTTLLLPRMGEAGWGLKRYDFGARMFDEQLGRWHVPDPMNQYISPYIGMGNRPSSMIDPDGMWSDAAYMSDLRGFDAYRLSKYRTYHNYNRETDVLGKSLDQLNVERLAGLADIDATQAYSNSIENIIVGYSNYAAADAIMTLTIKSITKALERLQDKLQIHEENSLPDGDPTSNPTPSDDDPPWDLDGDGKMSLKESYNWWKHGNGEPVQVPLSSLDLSSIEPSSFNGVGSVISINNI